MISFSCSHCGLKLKVKNEFGGRRANCPTCKKSILVPPPVVEPAPAERIDGTPSSLDQAGLQGGVILAPVEPGNAKSSRSVREMLNKGKTGRHRYMLTGELARGGMGAVLHALDCDIRREVAVKYLLDQKDARKKNRFIEEAQITGQLEHPNIVPIHELGVDAQKRLFFSMKMVKGRSLAQVLEDLRSKPKQAEKEYTLGRLLTMFVSICNALDYAHVRGVVHRDLKPSNIMLGDFGEVYVMDWGLAKVLNQPGSTGRTEEAIQAAPGPTSALTMAPENSQVATNRHIDADLTQEGAILGTPIYMPPEQAKGLLTDVDQRSDVYSLGAILYEILTLQAPVDKEGSHIAVLMRVVEGAVIPPEQRAPDRAARIPRELSAIAMKALAKNKTDRYPSVEAFRRDVERYLEGRSVSAKSDTTREMLWKLVKRNKGISVVTMAALLLVGFVLIRSYLANYEARRKTDHAYQAYRDHVKKAVPAFVRAARLSLERRQFNDALDQIEIALDSDPEDAAAQRLKAEVFIVRGDYGRARKELVKYLELRNDASARRLLALVRQAKSNDPVVLIEIAEEFSARKDFALSHLMLQKVSQFASARKLLLPRYRKQIEAAWPGLGNRLIMIGDGRFRLNLDDYGTQVEDLTPIRGIPLSSLSLDDCFQVRDLTPLRGMPLTYLNFRDCRQVRDLEPLRGMKLERLDLTNCEQIQDLDPLRGMPLQSLMLQGCVQVADLSPLRGMRLTMFSISNCRRVEDISPLRGMPLTSLNLYNCREVKDLSVIRSMPLTYLMLTNCRVDDLSIVRGMKLNTLGIANCDQVSDLTPLRGMPLNVLQLSYCRQVVDLSPLGGMDLHSLTLDLTSVTDLSPLQGMKLISINLDRCEGIHDLTPLRGMNLRTIILPPVKGITRGMGVIREMKSLRNIDVVTRKPMTATEFWTQYDAGQFNR